MIWRTLLLVSCGICLGLGAFTFYYGEGLSYFSADPKACVNCHIMQPQFDSWQKGSHHTVAKCVDCHLPKDFVGKWLAKAENGYFHSKGFTFQDFHEPIMIKSKNSDILKENCIRCHEGVLHGMLSANENFEQTNCLHCHRTVGHGERTGLGGREILEHLGE
jgi:cytochrome c nitrite reductase small subunit